jgi:Tol biopolymer transport system component
MSGILGFGLYEGVWSTLFSMACGSACLNVPATSVAFSIHLVSQLVGYSVAILSLCAIFMLLAKFNPGKLWRCALLIICWTSYPALAEDRSPLFSVLSPAALTGKIAFSATWKGKSRVYLLDLRAATVTPLSPDGIEASYPSFSPDGKYLALSIGPQDKRQIAVMASDGSGLRLLTTGPGASDHPAWSPDGKTIAFFSESPGNPKIANLFRLDPSQPGSALQITHYRGRNTTPQWSNDSTVLAFSTSRFWPGWDICLYNINLKEESCPLRGLRTYCRPRFSHYGDKLAYSTGAFDDVDIFIRDLKTARDTRLSALTGRDYDATWSPDDRFIAFTNSSGHEHFNLFVQALDSAQAHTLIKSEASIRYLSWVK